MSELPVPVVKPPEPPAAQTLVCANCHSPLNGEYCSVCGQRNEPHIHTVAHFAGEAFESISHADSRLWRTLWFLFARPGFLTKEFFAGRRVAYLPPFRLYLVMSVIFFTIVGLGGGDVSASMEIDEPLTATDVADMNAAAEAFETQQLGPMTAEQRAKVAAQLRAIASQNAATTAAPGAARRTGDEAGARATDDKTVDMMTGRGVQDGITQFCTDFKEGMGAATQAQTAKQQSVLRWCKRFGDEGFGAVGKALAQNIPKAMFVFLPLLAACMKLMYWRPKRYYVEHLLFMVHNHTFVFLVVGLLMLIGLIPVVGDYVWLLNLAAFFYMSWYIYRAMRNVYGQRRALTLAKYFAMVGVYILAGFAVFLLAVVYSAMTF